MDLLSLQFLQLVPGVGVCGMSNDCLVVVLLDGIAKDAM